MEGNKCLTAVGLQLRRELRVQLFELGGVLRRVLLVSIGATGVSFDQAVSDVFDLLSSANRIEPDVGIVFTMAVSMAVIVVIIIVMVFTVVMIITDSVLRTSEALGSLGHCVLRSSAHRQQPQRH